MKLQKMTDFVLNINKLLPKHPDQFFDSWQNRKISLINNYANFLKQPLKLEMFVSCDEEGNLLEEDLFKNNKNVSTLKPFERISLEKAKEKVLFEGFEIHYRDSETIILSDKNNNLIEFKTNGYIYALYEYISNTIEDALFFYDREGQDLIITQNQIKKLGL